MTELIQSRGVRRLSVRPSVCLSACKLFAQIASTTRQMARLRPNLNRLVSRWACIQDVLKEGQGHGHMTCAKIASSSTLMAALWPNSVWNSLSTVCQTVC